MATFDKTMAQVKQVHLRRILAGGNQSYVRLPWNIVTYDDGYEYIEPMNALSFGGSNQTFSDVNPPGTEQEFFVVDYPPFNETMQIQ